MGVVGKKENKKISTSQLAKIQTIMEEVAHDPEVRQAMEEAQRELGTITPEELRRQFTI